MNTYVIATSGAWRLYSPAPVPKGWRMLGTIELSDHTTGALGRSPAGLYAQINLGNFWLLDQAAVAEALRRVVLPVSYRRGEEPLRRR